LKAAYTKKITKGLKEVVTDKKLLKSHYYSVFTNPIDKEKEDLAEMVDV